MESSSVAEKDPAGNLVVELLLKRDFSVDPVKTLVSIHREGTALRVA